MRAQAHDAGNQGRNPHQKTDTRTDIRIEDREIVEGLIRRDPEALEAVITKFGQHIFNLAMRVTRSNQDAEEVVQDVLFTACTKIDRFEGKSALSSWLYRITVNHGLMKIRSRKPMVSYEEVAAKVRDSYTGDRSDTANVDYLTSRHEMRNRLEGALEKLPKDYRLIFILRDVDGLSNQEVAEIVAMSVPAVKSRLHRARGMLRSSLAEYRAELQSKPTEYEYAVAA